MSSGSGASSADDTKPRKSSVEDAKVEQKDAGSSLDRESELAKEAAVVAKCSDRNKDYMKNSILDEVLNSKKCALLQSPEVVKFFEDQQQQLKKKTSKK